MSDIQWLQASLAIREGGLGVTSETGCFVLHTSCFSAFLASITPSHNLTYHFSQPDHLLESIN